MNEKNTYQAPEVELVEIRLDGVILDASVNGSSSNMNVWKDDLGWDD